MRMSLKLGKFEDRDVSQLTAHTTQLTGTQPRVSCGVSRDLAVTPD